MRKNVLHAYIYHVNLSHKCENSLSPSLSLSVCVDSKVRCDNWISPQDRFLLQTIVLKDEEEAQSIDSRSVSLAISSLRTVPILTVVSTCNNHRNKPHPFDFVCTRQIVEIA
jgi:hypothetical protein